MENGWIYVLDDQLGHYKIGRASNPMKRIKALRIQLPFAVTIAYCRNVYDAVASERTLHQAFKHCRLNGEWFALNTQDWITMLGLLACEGARFYEQNGQFYEISDEDEIEYLHYYIQAVIFPQGGSYVC